MFCHNCGSQVDDKTVVCPHCGVQIGELHVTPTPTQQQPATAQDKNNTLAIVGFVLAFFIPLAGLICSAVALGRTAKEKGVFKWLALAGIIISVVMMIVNFYLSPLLFQDYWTRFFKNL